MTRPGSGGPITPRPAVGSDAPVIAAVFDAAVSVGWTYLGDLAAGSMFTPEDWERLVCDHRPSDALLVAETDGVVGHTAVHPEDREMFLLFVHSAHSGRAIGRPLLEAAHNLPRAGVPEGISVRARPVRAVADSRIAPSPQSRRPGPISGSPAARWSRPA